MSNTPEQTPTNAKGQIEEIRLGGTAYDIIVKKDWLNATLPELSAFNNHKDRLKSIEEELKLDESPTRIKSIENTLDSANNNLSTLSTALNEESKTREETDNSLSSRIASNKTDIANEISAREAADISLSNNLTNLSNRFTSIETAVTTTIPGTVTAEANTRAIEDSKLSSRLTDVEGEISSEKAKLTSIESDISGLSESVTQLSETIDSITDSSSGSAENLAQESLARSAADQKLLGYINELDLSKVITTSDIGDGTLCLDISFDKLVENPKEL